MFAFKYLIIAFSILAGLVASAPIDLSNEPELVVRARLSDMAKAVSIARQIGKKLRPEPNKAVFWSGTKVQKGKPVSVKRDAQRFARRKGKETLNMALKKNGIKIPTRKQNPLSTRLWNMASRTWARRASGSVDAVLGGKVRPGSVWKKIEKPTLKKNTKVTKVTEHNRQTRTSKVTKGKKR